MLRPELYNKHFRPVISGRVYFHRVRDEFVSTRTQHHLLSSSSLNSAKHTPHTASDNMVVYHLSQEKRFGESQCAQEKLRGICVL